MNRPYSNEDLLKMMDTAPLPVQQAVESKATVAVITGLGARFGLRIDQIGKIAELNRDALLGVIAPQDFLGELVASGISDKDAREIMADINQKIFVPLREAEEKEGVSMQKAAPLVAPEIESSTPSVRSTQGASLPPRAMMPISSAALPAKPMLLEDHEEPHMELGAIGATPAAKIAQIAPRSAQSPVNLPGTPPPPRAAAPQPRPGTVITAYTSDPYREPIDEEK